MVAQQPEPFQLLGRVRVLKIGHYCTVGACKGRGSLSGGFLLLEDPRLLLRWAAACWKRGRGASKGDPMDPMRCNVSDVQGLQGTHDSPHSSIVACL